METCSFCGKQQDVELSNYTVDKLFPNRFYYRCKNCGGENMITHRTEFIDITNLKRTMETNLKNIQQRRKIESRFRPELELYDDSITTSNIMPSNPFKNILKTIEEHKQFERELNIIENEKRKKRIMRPKTWGTQRVNCPHSNIVTRDGVTYCVRCGKNFNTKQLKDIGYYNETNSRFNDIDNQINSIFAREAGGVFTKVSPGEMLGMPHEMLYPFKEVPIITHKRPLYFNDQLIMKPMVQKKYLIEMEQEPHNFEAFINKSIAEMKGEKPKILTKKEESI